MSIPRPPVTTRWAEVVERGSGHVALGASWAAVEPERGAYDDGVLGAMRTACRAARRRGVEPVVVLHDGGLPDWIIRRGGWLDPEVQSGWGCYVERVGHALLEVARTWIGVWSPLTEAALYDRDERAAARALIEAQANARVLLRRGSGSTPAPVGYAEVFPGGSRWLRPPADTLSRVLLRGKFELPFAAVGELPNGQPGADFVVALDPSPAAVTRLRASGAAVAITGDTPGDFLFRLTC